MFETIKVPSGLKNPEIFKAVSSTLALSIFVQTCHWNVKHGEYAEHLLFQRIYEGVSGHLDSLAEKLLGLEEDGRIEYSLLLESALSCGKPSGESDIANCLLAEQEYINLLTDILLDLESKEEFSKGVDNLFAGIIDDHEEHIYLLKIAKK
jgi:DNA-binding ferritin-like protein